MAADGLAAEWCRRPGPLPVRTGERHRSPERGDCGGDGRTGSGAADGSADDRCPDRDRCRCGPGNATAVRKGATAEAMAAQVRERPSDRPTIGRPTGTTAGAERGTPPKPVRGDRRGHWLHSSNAAHGIGRRFGVAERHHGQMRRHAAGAGTGDRRGRGQSFKSCRRAAIGCRRPGPRPVRSGERHQ
jgi:hypothetical protein